MKKLLTAFFALALIGIVFSSCKKDDETVFDNSITIEGTFTIGDKTFTNPTFDLGIAEEHVGYVRPNYQEFKSVVPNLIKIEPFDDEMELEENIWLEYDYYIYRETVGTDESSEVYISIWDNREKQSLYISCYGVKTTVTKVDDVGGYIEGTYEGIFTNGPQRKDAVEYPVKGKFKVKRIPYETK